MTAMPGNLKKGKVFHAAQPERQTATSAFERDVTRKWVSL
jgi:hypothetical protein